MKKLPLCTLLFALAMPFLGQAQYTKYVVQLKNKAFTTFSFDNPQAFLSARAIARRNRYGLPIDSTDLPVTSRYIDSIKAVPNVQVLSNSRWLNQVLVKTSSAAAINQINAFTFVQATNPVAAKGSSNAPAPVKFNEGIVPIANSPIVVQQPTGIDAFNYGNSYQQVHIHNGEFLHNKNFSGQGMQIAVLDGGFNNYKTITAFDSVRQQGRILGERDFVAYDNSVNEDNQHGMQCLSIICGNWPGAMVGTAPGASFWLIRTEDVATESPIEEYNWVIGAEFADSAGADMISSSLGYHDFDGTDFDHTYDDLNGNTVTSTLGADLAAKKGILCTLSAGNDGANAWQYISAPSDADSVICVGAVNTSGQIASFSSRGIPADPRIKPGAVSVGSGTVLAGQNNQPTTGSGTSFSTPNLNGLVACLWQAFPEFNNQQIIDAVYQSSDRFANPNKTYGHGIPDFQKAYYILKKARNLIVFGPGYLKAAPNPFIDTVKAEFIGQKTGTNNLELIQPNGTVIARQSIPIEEQEIYAFTFERLRLFPAGVYTVKYNDGTSVNTVNVDKIDTQDTSNICPGSHVKFNSGNSSVGNTYQWQEDNGSGFTNISNSPLYSGITEDVLELINPPTSWYNNKYRCLISGSTFSKVYTLKFVNIWTGIVNNQWENPLNWGCGNLPDGNTDVLIPNGSPLLSSNAACRSIKLSSAANLTVNPNFNLTITH